jgi:tetratricopeptide (TPR) repeat protein
MSRKRRSNRPAPRDPSVPARPVDGLIAAFLVVATLAVFGRACANGFVNYDDGPYATQNRHVQNGLTVDGIRWAFSTTQSGNWHPLTWLTLQLDSTLFGTGRPAGYHLTNVLLHAANSALLFLVFARMTQAPWRSALVAALFAFHPLHVESVAWVSERKDVLSTLFWMLTLFAYVRYTERPRRARYLMVALFLTLGLAAKPMLVTLPFVLLLLDYWPLRRSPQEIAEKTARTLPLEPRSRGLPAQRVLGPAFTPGDDALGGPPSPVSRGFSLPRLEPGDSSQQVQRGRRDLAASGSPSLPSSRPSWTRLLVEKIPFFAIAVVFSGIALFAQNKEGALRTFEEVPFRIRLENVPVAYVRYIGMTLWPQRLAVFYPLPAGDFPIWQWAGSLLLLIAVSIFAFRYAARWPWLAVGWLWYPGTLVPVIGIVQVGRQALADRYSYVPSIGLFLIAGWGMAELFCRLGWSRRLLWVGAGTAIASCMAVTWLQIAYWHDSVTLWQRAIECADSDLAYSQLGQALAEKGERDPARQQFLLALERNPDNAQAHYNLGRLLADEGKLDEAIARYTEALRIDPAYTKANGSLGIALAQQGHVDRAIGYFILALRSAPDSPEAHYNLGVAFGQKGNRIDAIQEFSEALRIDPTYTPARQHLDAILSRK